MLKTLACAWPAMLMLATVMLAPDFTTYELPPREAPWHKQVAAVRAGPTTTIRVDRRPIRDRQLARIEDLLRLGELELGQSHVTAAGLRHLQPLGNLKRVTLRGPQVDDAILAALCEIPSIRAINLPRSTITDKGLTALATHPKLQYLRIGSPHISDAGMEAITALPELRVLHLIGVPITDRGLAELASMTQLESLYIDDAAITDVGIERLLKRLPGLHFHINQEHHDRDPLRHAH